MGNFREVNEKFSGSEREVLGKSKAPQTIENQENRTKKFLTKKICEKYLLPLGKLGGFLLISFTAHAQGYDKAPEFPGGNPGLEKYLTANVKYPEAARKKNLEGKVLIGFTVDDKGKVININVLQKVHPLLDNEATRVVRAMPRWKPATKGTQKVVAPVALPITFRLRDEPKKK